MICTQKQNFDCDKRQKNHFCRLGSLVTRRGFNLGFIIEYSFPGAAYLHITKDFHFFHSDYFDLAVCFRLRLVARTSTINIW